MFFVAVAKFFNLLSLDVNYWQMLQLGGKNNILKIRGCVYHSFYGLSGHQAKSSGPVRTLLTGTGQIPGRNRHILRRFPLTCRYLSWFRTSGGIPGFYNFGPEPLYSKKTVREFTVYQMFNHITDVNKKIIF